MSQINEQLRIAYQAFIPALMNTLKQSGTNYGELSAPLLLHVFPDYALAANKLFLVGQETNWWGEEKLGGKKIAQHSSETVSLLMQCYEQFAMGKRLEVGRRYNSPLWRFAPSLYHKLNPEATSSTGYLWSNLYKTDQRGKRPDTSVQAALRACQPNHILRQEIGLAKPDTVVFVTGHGLDWEIRCIFPGATFTALDNRFLARVTHPELPLNTFRTYHPSYLQRKGRVESMANQILHLIEAGHK